jgi:nucleoside-diphosphate-sugar epimerase
MPPVKHILVTGATGFVGQAACRSLAAAGYQVRQAVRQPPAHPDAQTCVVGDIGTATDWSAALEGIEVVLHLAGRAHVLREAPTRALGMYRAVNVDGTIRLANRAAEAGVRRLVFVSSIKVQGEATPLMRPFCEDDPPAPQDAYGQSKWEAEQALWQLASSTGLEVVMLRPPLIYGAGVKANFLRLLQAVERGVPLPLASVTNRRSLLFVGNMVSALEAAMQHPQAAGQCFLLSDGSDISTPDLVRRLAHLMHRPARLLPCPASLLFMAGRIAGRAATVERLSGSLVVDSSRIRQRLGWHPPATLDQGLAETVRWFRSRAH